MLKNKTNTMSKGMLNLGEGKRRHSLAKSVSKA